VAELFPHQVERDACGDGRHPKTVPQALWARACGPSRPAAAMTACTARQPVMRDQGGRDAGQRTKWIAHRERPRHSL
jgi:hypothetical protein